MRKRILALVLSLAMCFAMMPEVALASDEQPEIFLSENAAVLDGINTISGVQYQNVIQFSMNNNWLGNNGEINYNLHGEYRSVSFHAGYMSGLEKNATMTVYADGEKIDEVTIAYDKVAQKYTYNMSGVRHFRIYLSSDGYDTKKYGIGNINFVAAGEIGDHTYASDEFYDTYNSGVRTNLTTQSEPFSMGGNVYESGYILSMNGNWLGHTGKAGFNFQGHFKKMSFDVGFISGVMGSDIKMTIEADNTTVYEEELIYCSDIPRHIELDLNGVSGVVITFTTTPYDTQKIGIGNIQLESDGTPLGILMSKTSATLTSTDSQVQVTGSVYPSDAFDRSVTYSSDKEDTAIVSETGLVTGIKSGTANIYARSPHLDIPGSCAVTSKISAVSFSLSHNKFSYGEDISATTRAIDLKWSETSTVDAGYEILMSKDSWLKNASESDLMNLENVDVDVQKNNVSKEVLSDELTYTTNALDRSTTYYFRMRAYYEIDGETYYGSFSGCKSMTTENIYSAKDAWGFENFTSEIGWKYFKAVFKNAPAKRNTLYDENHNQAICYGMAASAVTSLYKGVPNASSWKDSMFDISERNYNDKNSALGMSALDLCYLAHIYQYTETIQNTVKGNKGDISGLVSAVKAGKPVLISMYPGSGSGGHAVWAIRVVSDTSDQTVIEVYDSNFSRTSEYQYPRIIFNKILGGYSNYEYQVQLSGTIYTFEGSNGDSYKGSKNKISYTSSVDDFSQWLTAYISGSNASLSTDMNMFQIKSDSDKTRASLIELLEEQYAHIQPMSGDSSGTTSDLFYINEDTIALENVPAGVEISLISDEHSVSATADQSADIKLSISDSKQNSAEVISAKDGIYKVSFYDTSASGAESEQTTVSGSTGANSAALIRQTDDDIQVNGVKTICYHTESGTENNGVFQSNTEGTVAETTVATNESYQIKHDANKIYVNYGSDFSKNLVTNDMGVPISSCKVTMPAITFVYQGSEITPAYTVTNGTKTLRLGTDYQASLSNNINVGTATLTITGKGNYTGRITKTFTITKANPAINVKTTAKKYKKAAVKKKKQTFSIGASVIGKGKLTYKFSKYYGKSKKYLTISKTTGKITVKKGTPKGTYKVKVKISAAANRNCNAATKTVTIKVAVK